MRHVQQRDIKASPPKVDESCHNINESCPAIATRVISWCAAATKSATRRATYNQRVMSRRQRVMSRHSHTSHVVLVRSCNSKCDTTCDIKSTSHARVMSSHNRRVMSRQRVMSRWCAAATTSATRRATIINESCPNVNESCPTIDLQVVHIALIRSFNNKCDTSCDMRSTSHVPM